MLLVDGWTQFKIIATGNGEKLEDWNGIKLLRPDPQIIWPAKSDLSRYPGLAARYVRSAAGGGAWEVLGIRGQEPGVRDAAVGRGPSSSAENVAVQKGGGSKPPPYVSETHNPSAIPHSSLLIPNSSPMPDEWNVSYRDLTFRLKPMGFKHTGLFPEQAANWDLMRALIRGDGEWGMGNTGVAFALAPPRSAEGDKDNILSAFEPRTPNPEPRKQNSSASSSPIPHPPPPPKILNLFAYTGGATVACAKEGAFVTHVDAAKGMVERAKLNCKLSGVGEKSVRWIVEDCKKFLEREIRRGQTYDAIIMDPPSYGRGASGEVWKLEDSLYELVELSVRVLSPNPLFFLLNSYTTGLGAHVMQNLLTLALKSYGGSVKAYELCLPTEEEGVVLPCGNSALWISAVVQ